MQQDILKETDRKRLIINVVKSISKFALILIKFSKLLEFLFHLYKPVYTLLRIL